jgi:magnesium-transporting ATPase (P-type)
MNRMEELITKKKMKKQKRQQKELLVVRESYLNHIIAMVGVVLLSSIELIKISFDYFIYFFVYVLHSSLALTEGYSLSLILGSLILTHTVVKNNIFSIILFIILLISADVISSGKGFAKTLILDIESNYMLRVVFIISIAFVSICLHYFYNRKRRGIG